MNEDPFIRYYVTSPCGRVDRVECIGGPTSDPFAMRGNAPMGGGVVPLCTGLGSLNGTGAHNSTPIVTHVGATTLNISLANEHCNGKGHGVFNIICDDSVNASNPPELIVEHNKLACSFTVTWRHPSVCSPKPTTSGHCTSSAPPAPPPAKCSVCLPPWKPTWNMSRSTALYTCNSTGMHSVAEAIRYGITVYDWSNAKLLWANAHPMNDDELLTKQAEAVLAADPGIPGEQPRVWVYRNKIKALNWYSSVREKLDDPAFAGWFVKFKNYHGGSSNNSYAVPTCDWFGSPGMPPKCSGFYHDQVQSPTRIGAGPAYSRPANDGSNVCQAQCDCGPINPCGEYTFDHRNTSFSEWYVNEYMISNQTLLHKPQAINLGWMDDGMQIGGMTEGAPIPTWMVDTGTTPQEMEDHIDAFKNNVGRLQQATVANGGFYWQMIQGDGPNIRPVQDYGPSTCHSPKPRNVSVEQCVSTLREWCTSSPPQWDVAHLYLVCPKEMEDPDIALQATAEFLLTRGPYAWIGYGWNGCNFERYPNGTRPRPKIWDYDFGEASSACTERKGNSGIFEREYPSATISWNCNTHAGAIQTNGLRQSLP